MRAQCSVSQRVHVRGIRAAAEHGARHRPTSKSESIDATSLATPASNPPLKKSALALLAAATIPEVMTLRMLAGRLKSCAPPEMETMTSGLGTRQ